MVGFSLMGLDYARKAPLQVYERYFLFKFEFYLFKSTFQLNLFLRQIYFCPQFYGLSSGFRGIESKIIGKALLRVQQGLILESSCLL